MALTKDRVALGHFSLAAPLLSDRFGTLRDAVVLAALEIPAQIMGQYGAMVTIGG